MRTRMIGAMGWVLGLGLGLAGAGAAGLEPSAGLAAKPRPARVGVYVVTVELRSSGDSSGQVVEAGGSVSWGDQYACTLTSVARFEVVQDGLNAYSTDLLDGQTTLTVSGGGHSNYRAKDGISDERAWTYAAPDWVDLAQPSAGGEFSTEDVEAFAGIPDLPPLVVVPPDVSGFTGGWSAANDAVRGLGGGFEFKIPPDIVSWAYSQARATNVAYSGGVIPGQASGTASVTAEVKFVPDSVPEWEAVLEPGSPIPGPGAPAYEDWMPEGNLREGNDDPGNGIPVRVYLRARNGGAGVPPKAKFRFQLSEVSREPGVLMNFPPTDRKGCDTTSSGPFDLRIFPGPGLDVAGDGQSARTLADEAEYVVAIAAYDFGAYGKLKVTATLPDGSVLVAHRKSKPELEELPIPEDANGNHVADAWERARGVYDDNLPAKWDGAAQPAGQALKGDGYSLYEKYRGFLVLNPLGKEVYERLDPRLKHVFVFDPDHLAREIFSSAVGWPVSYEIVGECEVRYLGTERWTGAGTFTDRKRVVNFNCSADKHAVDQHALHVHFDASPSPENPQDILDLYHRAKFTAPKTPAPATEGRTYQDPTAPKAARDQWRPAGALRIEIYLGGVSNYVQSVLEYHSVAGCPGCVQGDFEKAVKTYAAAHGADGRRKRGMELSATITHEMGHGTGARHHVPDRESFDDPQLRHCTMRYYVPEEYPADENDRYELSARGENPSKFCRTRFDCWSRIKITDNPEAAPDGAGASSMHGRRMGSVAMGGAPAPAEVEAIALSADLSWDSVFEGDPMRLRVRLHGPTDRVSAAWVTGLRLGLWRDRADGTHEAILGSGPWTEFLEPVTFDTSWLAVSNVTRVRDFLVPAARAGLAAGDYRLELTWEGRTLAPDAVLPMDGVVSSAPVRFSVRTASNAVEQATHWRHRAWERYLSNDAEGAWQAVEAAERLDGGAEDPLALRTRLLAVNCAARRTDPLGMARYARALRSRGEDDNGHFFQLADSWLDGVSPRLRVLNSPAFGAGESARLEVRAFPGGRYVLERSGNLVDWEGVSTNTPTAGTYEVADPGAAGGPGRYYRVRWVE